MMSISQVDVEKVNLRKYTTHRMYVNITKDLSRSWLQNLQEKFPKSGVGLILENAKIDERGKWLRQNFKFYIVRKYDIIYSFEMSIQETERQLN